MPCFFAFIRGISGCLLFLSTWLHFRDAAVLLEDVSGSQIPGWEVLSFPLLTSCLSTCPHDVSDLRGWACERHPWELALTQCTPHQSHCSRNWLSLTCALPSACAELGAFGRDVWGLLWTEARTWDHRPTPLLWATDWSRVGWPQCKYCTHGLCLQK